MARILTTLLLILALNSPLSAAGAALFSTLSPTPDWVDEGGQQGAEYGHAVAAAGDVNGDGYADFLVGAPRYTQAVYKEGAAFLYLGGDGGPDANANWSGASGQQGSEYGASLAGAGDVNGDGYADVLVGAPMYKTSEGAAFAYYGSPNGLAEAPDWLVEGANNDGEFGGAVAGAGDVNGDGYADVLVGAHHYSLGQANEGAAFLYYGAANGLRSTPAWSYESNQDNARLGAAVASAGDINRDGYADILVGAPSYDNGEIDEGAVFVFYGSLGGLAQEPDQMLEANRPGAWFGYALAAAGDVNGNGYGDVLIGAPLANDGQDGEGLAFYYQGSAQGLYASANWLAAGNGLNAWFGGAVAGAGDVDQDGYADILIGAYKQETDQPDEGLAFLYRGSNFGPQPDPAWRAEGNKAEATFGFAASGAGDVDKDGYTDILIGAPLYRLDEKTIMGRAYLFNGSAEIEMPDNFRIHLAFITNP